MAPASVCADANRVHVRLVFAVLAGVLAVDGARRRDNDRECRATRSTAPVHSGYSYAGHQAMYRGHGVRATIS